MRHHNDLTSVTSWVYDMQSQPYNPIIIFKQQGQEQSDDVDNVAVTDFLLGIQIEFQHNSFLEQYVWTQHTELTCITSSCSQ